MFEKFFKKITDIGVRRTIIDTRKYSIYPSNLNLVETFCEIDKYFSENGFKEQTGLCERAKYIVRIDDNRNLLSHNYTDFSKILKKYPKPKSVYIHTHWESKTKLPFMWGIDLGRSSIEFEVEADDLTFLDGLHEQSRRIFQASNLNPEKSPYLSRYNLKKTIFLAHRFDDSGKNVSAALEKLLRRIGFQIVVGEGYEARDIPQKIRDRILTQDIFICLVTLGDSSWIISETTFAMAHNKYIIIICEDGVEFKKGIIGTDYEHITFPKDNIEKSFSDIVYALPS
jgi:hypothetical protein